MNINIEKCMVSENDPEYQLNKRINDSLVDIAKGFTDFSSEKRVHCILARPLGSSGVKNENIVTTPILTTSANASKSIADENYRAKEIEKDAGVLNVAMYAALMQNGGEIFVFGSTSFTSDVYYSEFTLNDKNADFIKSCIRSVLPKAASYNIKIPVIPIDSYKLNEKTATTAMSTGVMIVFMIILPLILSSLAVIIYNKRKNL